MKVTRLNPATIQKRVQLSFLLSLFHIDPCAAIGRMNPMKIQILVTSPEVVTPAAMKCASTQT